VKIRHANRNDEESIARIHIDSWRATYQKTLSKDYLENIAPNERTQTWKDRLVNSKSNQLILVAEIEGEVVGFACAFFNENAQYGSYLDNLHVLAKHQSKGVGRLLISEIADWCIQQSTPLGLCLLVNQENEKAQNFYKFLGARNAEDGVWNAPDGTVVPTFWFVWDRLDGLLEMNQKD
jgi:GNAT superfamily N-acetyltransferase